MKSDEIIRMLKDHRKSELYHLYKAISDAIDLAIAGVPKERIMDIVKRAMEDSNG